MTYTLIHIIKFITLTIVLGVSFFVFSLPSAHAYFTTNQDVITPTTDTMVFLIDYVFGHKSNNIHLPVLADRSSVTQSDSVSYSILDSQNVSASGTVTALVLSDAKIHSDGMYIIPRGQAKKFTLAVIFTTNVPNNNEQYRLQVNNLPFNFNNDQQLQLNPSELKYYTTKLISL